MKKQQLTIIILFIIAGIVASVITCFKVFNAGYNNASQKGYDYADCVERGGAIAVSDPPQCFNNGTHTAP